MDNDIQLRCDNCRHVGDHQKFEVGGAPAGYVFCPNCKKTVLAKTVHADRRDARITALEAALKAALEEVDDWREVDRLQALENDTGEEAYGMSEARDALHKSMSKTDRLRKECGL